MSPEFENHHGSSRHEHSKLYELRSSTLRGFAERSENQELLEKFLFIMAERALGDEYNTEADDVTIFIHQKLEYLRQKDRDDEALMEVAIQKLADEDYIEARKFFEVYPYYFEDDDPQLAQLEREHEALFKQQ